MLVGNTANRRLVMPMSRLKKTRMKKIRMEATERMGKMGQDARVDSA